MSGEPAHILHVFATFTAAGPQLRTVDLIDALGDAYRHTVVAMDGRTDAREHLAEPERVQLLPAPSGGTLACLRAFRRLFQTLRPNVLCTYNWGAIEAALAARTLGLGAKHIHHEDGFRPDEVAGLKTRRNLFRRVALAASGAVVVVSHGLFEAARRRWGVRASRLHLVPNGIHLDAFANADGSAVRAELGIPADAFVIGWVGHLRPEKNPRRLIAAVAAMQSQDVHVLMLGDGPERAGLDSDVAQYNLGERVHFAGFREQTAPFYAAMNVFVISSDTEQMPIALVEAMASGLPVAATDVGDVRAMLPPEQEPFVVSAREGDPVVALADALNRLIATPSGVETPGSLDANGRRIPLGAANLARATDLYAFSAMLATYERLYGAATSLTVR